MKNSIIVPIRNQRNRIKQFLTNLCQECDKKYGQKQYEIIVIDNASTDGVRHELFYDKTIIFLWSNSKLGEKQLIEKAKSYALGEVKEIRRIT